MSLSLFSLCFILTVFTHHAWGYTNKKNDKMSARFLLFELSQNALKQEMDLKFHTLENQIAELKVTGYVGKAVERLKRKYQNIEGLLGKLSDQLNAVQQENKILKAEIAALKKVVEPEAGPQGQVDNDAFPDTTSSAPNNSRRKEKTDNPVVTPKALSGVTGVEEDGTHNGSSTPVSEVTTKPFSGSGGDEETISVLEVTTKPFSGSVGDEEPSSVLEVTTKSFSGSVGDEETDSVLEVTTKRLSESVGRDVSASKGRNGRLLVAPWGHAEPLQVNLSDYTVSNYSLGISDYQSVVFIPKIQSLIVTGIAPFNLRSIIYVSRINSSDLQPLVRNYACHASTVDEDRELIVVTTFRPRKTVSSLKYDGSDLKTIADLSAYNYPYGLALDYKLRRIYVCTDTKLLSMTYNGNDVRVVHSGKNIMTVTADMTDRVLYFNDDTGLMKHSLDSGETVTMVNLAFTPWNFIHARGFDGSNNLYVSSLRGRMVGVFKLDTNSSYIPILPGCTPCRYVSAICLIP
ncbi:uncharacterized protein LOC124266818 [Haliotis rubra]|uniref:uncharacterized protein LOC124266818 n=1 Tax=Haliotis rubra TaxID=36100 RepID=UPI001EE5BDD0|nr:uncharacterized protein LOC124266818 [Haliotis rubra]